MFREDLSTAEESAPWLDRSLAVLARVNWETVAWTALLIISVVSRFYDVGARAMSHDESLHAVYSYELYKTGKYVHNPMMHGPFLFHANALMYFLFGVTDATTRIVPALTGIGTIAMAWAFRRWLGRTGALCVGLLFAISPSILFHSRYIRNDIYIALSAMVWIYSLFRYVEERKVRWLYWMVAGMVFGFVSKENQFMSGALFGVFIGAVALWRWWREGEALQNNVFADIAVLMLTLVLPYTAPFGYLVGEKLLGWPAIEWSNFAATTPMLVEFSALTVICIALSVGIAHVWFDQLRVDDGHERLTFATWGGLMLTFWGIAILFYTTFFTNPVNGLATGIVGSLGYWLAQHDVQRGSQPGYYYVLLAFLYEFLPLLLSLCGAATLLSQLRNKSWAVTPLHDLPAGVEAGEAETPANTIPPSMVRRILVVFLLWWAVGAWVAYSYAGEKMPWLMTHLAQPMGLLGGWWLGQLISRIDWRQVWQRGGIWLMALAPALIFSIATLFAANPFGGRDLESIGGTIRFLLAALLCGGLLYLAWQWTIRIGWRPAARLLFLGVAAVLFLLTVRFSYMLTYVNYDMATEYLVYAHGGPDVKRALAEIDEISARTAGDRQIRIAYSNDSAWPMSWYMKFYPNSVFFGTTPSQDTMSAPIVIAGSDDYAKVDPYLARDYVYREYRMIWWPEEGYKNLTWSQVWGALTDPARRQQLWQIWFYRNHPQRSVTEWPHRHEFRLYIQKDLARLVWDLNVIPTETQATAAFDYPELEWTAATAYTALYDDAPLNQPRDVAVGPDGSRYLLDSGNNRVVVLDPTGNLVRTFGSGCLLNEASQDGCVDPDGSGPLQVGDGQFREPWGIAAGADGTIYVADTWNGRIHRCTKPS